MRKYIFFIILYLVSFTLVAQSGVLVEVRGVETRWASYDSIEPAKKSVWGFAFTNMNKFSISIDAELMRNPTDEERRYGIKDDVLVNTKSFVLDPGEEYIWQLEFNHYNIQTGAYMYGGTYFNVRFKAFRN